MSDSPGPFPSFFVVFMDYLRILHIKHETQRFNAFKTPLKQYEVFQRTSRFSDPYSNKKTYCPVYDADFRRKIYGGKRKI